MPILLKLLLGFLSVTLFTGMLGVLAYRSISEIGALAMATYDKPLMAINFARAAETEFHKIGEALKSSDLGSGASSAEPASNEEPSQGPTEAEPNLQTEGETDLVPEEATEEGEPIAEIIESRLEDFVDDLEIASERALTEDSRQAAEALMEQAELWAGNVESLLEDEPIDVDAFSALSAEIEVGLEELVEISAGEGFEFRLAAEEEVARQVKIMIAAVAATLLAAVLIALVLAFVIVRPVKRAVLTIEALAEGDTTAELRIKSGDELGKLAKAVESLRQGMISLKNLQAKEVQREAKAKAKLKTEMLTLSDRLDRHVKAAVDNIRAKVSGLNGLAGELRNTAQQVSLESSAVTSAAEGATASVQTVASAAEEMSSSIREISNQVDRSTEITGNAVREANESNKKVEGLSDAAKEIEAVVTMINEIAEQTNLLALNATIEAARAGEMGKGFAVVASEVKSLANQTATATEQIKQQIKAIQVATGESVAAITHIRDTVNEVNEIASSIAGSVNEQTGATQEIARSAQEAATGTQEVSSSIGQVSAASRESEGLADSVRTDAEEMKNSIEALQTELTQILRTSDAGDRREHERIALQRAAEVSIGNQWHRCEINDISAGGAEIRYLDGLVEGAELRFKMDGYDEIHGRVRRVTDKSCAIAFNLDDMEREALNLYLLDLHKAA